MDEKWLVPWRPFTGLTADGPLVNELRSELCASHRLFGIPVRPVGGRQDCDDVLFELLDGSGRFAVVHLTYAQHPEPDPRWPETHVYDSWAHFERETMKPDHNEWACE